MVIKYIHFVKIADKPKTSVWACRNNTGDYEIGIVKWNTGWRQYCFFPASDMVFSMGCLQDIYKFIESLRQSKDDEFVATGCGGGVKRTVGDSGIRLKWKESKEERPGRCPCENYDVCIDCDYRDDMEKHAEGKDGE